tara:strand:- start:7104 stop:7799 length:696 start_codon:yes stop_codon:yes gene_type:complete
MILILIMACVAAALAVLGATNPQPLSRLPRAARRQFMRINKPRLLTETIPLWWKALQGGWHYFRFVLHTGRLAASGGADTPANRDNFTQLGGLGFRVDKATAALPQTTDGTLFTITGGRVLLTLIVGEVTTVIQTQANNMKLKFNPDASGADQDLCAVLDVTGDAVGELYTISGTVGDALRSDLLIGLASLKGETMILSEGLIELDCSASNTGSVKWSMWYYPLDLGATVA